MTKQEFKQSMIYVVKRIGAFFSNNKKRIVSLLLSIGISVLFLLLSGYSYTEFAMSDRFMAVLLILLLAVCSLVFIANVDVKKIKDYKNLLRIHRGNIKNVVLFAILGLLFVSFAFALSDSSNTNGIFRFAFVFLSAIFLVFSVPQKTIINVFIWTLRILCVVSLFFYFVSLFMPSSFVLEVFVAEKGALVYNYYYLSFSLRSWTSLAGISQRMCSVFWEPSIFAAYLSMAMFLEIMYREKVNLFDLSLFGFCLLLTRSTGGILLALILVLLWISKKISGRKRFILLAVCGVAVLGIVIFFDDLLIYAQQLLPDIFGKISGENSSFVTRSQSLFYFLKVYAQKPIFGHGPAVAMHTYLASIEGTMIDSATSSFGHLIASFGIPGILVVLLVFYSPIFLKKEKYMTIMIMCAFMFIILNLQNVMFLPAFFIIPLLVIKNGFFDSRLSLSETTPESDKVLSIFSSRNGEVSSIARNINGSLVIKGAAMFIGVIAIPVYNAFFVFDEVYGLWLTIISVLSWVMLFDFGFGSGLRTKLNKAIESGDDAESKKLISSTYVGTAVISAFILAVLLALIWSLDLNAVFNISETFVSSFEIKISMTVLAVGVCLEFLLKNIIYVLYAIRKSALAASMGLITTTLLLLFFLIFKSMVIANKILVSALVYSFLVNIPLLIITIVIFSKKLRGLGPKISHFSMAAAKKVMSIGLMFFLIQLGFFIITQTDSFLISNIFSSAQVVDYTKYSKIFVFFIGLMGTVVQQPMWSAISTAKAKGDILSIKKYSKITFAIAIFLAFCCVVTGAGLQIIFNVWLGEYTLTADLRIVSIFIAYSLIYIIANAFIVISNGLEVIKIQAVVTLISAVFKIVAVYILANFIPNNPIGWELVIIVDALCYIPYLIVLPIANGKNIKKIKEFGRES